MGGGFTTADRIELDQLQEKVKKHMQELLAARKDAQEWRQKVEAMEEARDLQEGNTWTHQDSVEVNELKQKLAKLGKDKKE
jgi:hypothetical protein